MNEEKNKQPYTSPYDGAKCASGHELEFISEGFALCNDKRERWWAWSMSPAHDFEPGVITGRDGKEIPAYIQGRGGCSAREKAIAIIDEAMQAMREQSYDEERERRRLIPV